MVGRRCCYVPALLSLIGAAGSPPPPAIHDIRALTLHGGVNRVPGFLPGGGGATIVQAWRDNGNAHGYFVWMVIAGPERGTALSDGLVEFEGRKADASTISASPFDGERVTADVRFARARMGGREVSLAIEGWLNEAPSGIVADHATATVRWYRLVHRRNAIGVAPDAFVPIGSVQTTKRYCNVDLALRDVAGIALPAAFAGANKVDGCFPDG